MSGDSSISYERLLGELGFSGAPSDRAGDKLLGHEVDKLFIGKEYDPIELNGEGWTGRFLRRTIERSMGAGMLRISDVRTCFDHDGEIIDRRALVLTEIDRSGNPTDFVKGFTIDV